MKLLCIVGPTATGKSALAVELARRLDGEVVSCDSMQVYRGLDIGTAKPTVGERGGIPHHMLDVADPWEDYSAARYAAEADQVVRDIIARNKRPIVAGGTGLYLRALTVGLHTAQPGDPAVRERWETLLAGQGREALHRALAQLDPDTAARLSPHDSRRILRALEVYSQTGMTLSSHHEDSQRQPPRYRTLIIGLRMDREALYRRINARVDEMIDRGLPGEAAWLRAHAPVDCTAMQAIGYKELCAYLDGLCSLSKAVDSIKQATRRYAKRQMTWFSRQAEARWLDVDGGLPVEEALRELTVES